MYNKLTNIAHNKNTTFPFQIFPCSLHIILLVYTSFKKQIDDSYVFNIKNGFQGTKRVDDCTKDQFLNKKKEKSY